MRALERVFCLALALSTIVCAPLNGARAEWDGWAPGFEAFDPPARPPVRRPPVYAPGGVIYGAPYAYGYATPYAYPQPRVIDPGRGRHRHGTVAIDPGRPTLQDPVPPGALPDPIPPGALQQPVPSYIRPPGAAILPNR